MIENETQDAFVAMAARNILKAMGNDLGRRLYGDNSREYMLLQGVAQAAIETGWGKAGWFKDSLNLFGIKPVFSQPHLGPRWPFIRKFISLDASATSWLYLLCQSGNYAAERLELREHLLRMSEYHAYLKFTQSFLKKYAPPRETSGNATYFQTYLRILPSVRKMLFDYMMRVSAQELDALLKGG
jgi:hypothetical protein